MALRQQDLEPAQGATLYRFPTWASAPARRRRAAARRRGVGVLVAVAATLLLAAGGSSGGAPAGGHSEAPRHVMVGPGDTLWDIAQEMAPPGTDPRAYVAAVLELNDVTGPLPAGTRLRLPR